MHSRLCRAWCWFWYGHDLRDADEFSIGRSRCGYGEYRPSAYY